MCSDVTPRCTFGMVFVGESKVCAYHAVSRRRFFYSGVRGGTCSSTCCGTGRSTQHDFPPVDLPSGCVYWVCFSFLLVPVGSLLLCSCGKIGEMARCEE